MPSFRHLLPRHEDNSGSKSSKWPKSPTSPKSPKSPKSPNYNKTARNPDGLNQCTGCDNVERLISRNVEDENSRLDEVTLHGSFEELEECAHKCETCRVFRQSLVLEEVTFEGVKKIRKTMDKVVVRWQKTTMADGAPKAFLVVEVKGELKYAGVVNCHTRNDVSHLALRVDGLDAAVIEQAKEWLNTCVNSHVGQCDNLKWSSENPQLLVEILSPTTVRLRENQQGDYVALSYCWGKDSVETERGKTLMSNLDRRRQPFPISELPATVRDTLHILREMRVRFAWVDTLCIVQDNPEGLATMHKVYSNALFTLNACATTRAIDRLLDHREAWIQKTEPCRLGARWLTTPDMSLNELRLRSPLAGRAWTLQEERLSPRMLYISSNRIYWSCAKSQEMEMKPRYRQEAGPPQRPVYAASDRNTQIPLAQEFLLACYAGTTELHAYWADIVRSYAARNMSNMKDRLKAVSGLAAKYLSASSQDRYLAGLWENNLAEGLAWRVDHMVEDDDNARNWPSWSWAALPTQTTIATDFKCARSPHFQYIGADDSRASESRDSTEDAITQGERLRNICVSGRLRPFWKPASQCSDWWITSRLVGEEEKFTFAANPEQDVHAVEIQSGRIMVYEDRKREIIGQLDFRRDVERLHGNQVELWALELGVSTLLLLEYCGESIWRRVGAAWSVREDYFAPAQRQTLIIR
jgi:hypothetical protein